MGPRVQTSVTTRRNYVPSFLVAFATNTIAPVNGVSRQRVLIAFCKINWNYRRLAVSATSGNVTVNRPNTRLCVPSMRVDLFTHTVQSVGSHT